MRFPVPEVRAAWDSLLHYGEHSAPEGPGDHRRLTRREILYANREHYEYATKAFHDTETLLELGTVELARAVRTPGFDTIAVFNPSAWPRTNFVRVGTGGTDFDSYIEPPRLTALVDLETGDTIPCDNDAMSEAGGDAVGPDAHPCATFVATDVPPMGYRLYKAVHATETEQRTPVPEAISEGPVTIENDKYRIDVDATTGAVTSLFDKELNAELATGADNPFNAIHAAEPTAPSGVDVRRLAGRTFQRIEIRRPRSWFPETDIRLDSGAAHVEWRNVYDRAAWKSQNPEAQHWRVETRFPLALSGENARLVVSGPNGFRRVPEDSLSGITVDGLPETRFIAATDGDRCVVIASPSDYLFLMPLREAQCLVMRTQTVSQGFGPIGLRFAPHAHMPSLEPGEDGIIAHRYALTSHAGDFDPVRAQRFGSEFSTELAGVFAPAKPAFAHAPYPMPDKPAPAARSFVRIEDPAGGCRVDVAVFRRSLLPGQSFYILRLQELVGDAKRTIRVKFDAAITPRSAALADMTERKGDSLPLDPDGAISLSIGPFETLTLALDFATTN